MPLENACHQHGTQKNLLGTAGSVPALLPPPPRQLLCLSLLGALPSPPSIGGFRAPSAPQTPTRFLRAWEARAAPAQLPGREELPADVCSSALRRARGKTGSARPSGAAGTRPQPSLVTVLVSLEGRDVPGDVWQVLVPVLWGFIGLAELEPHPERCIPSIPKSPMAPHALGKEDANPTPSWHPRPPHQSLSISSPGLHRRDIPAGIQLPAISGSKAPNGKASLGTQLQFPFILAGDCHGNRCQRDGAAQHPTPHRDIRDEAFPRCKLTTSQPRENLDLQTPSSSLPQSCSWL